MILTDLPQVQALSVREKLELVDELWKAVSEDLNALKVTQEEKDILDQRWDAYLQDPSSALTLDQFKLQMRALRA